MSGVKRWQFEALNSRANARVRQTEHGHYVLASDYDRDVGDLKEDRDQQYDMKVMARQQRDKCALLLANTEAERDELRVQVEAMRLLLQQCDKDITEDGGVYIELRAFLFGTLPTEDVIALLGEQPVSQAKP